MLETPVEVTYDQFTTIVPLCSNFNNFKTHIQIALQPPKEYYIIAVDGTNRHMVTTDSEYNKCLLEACSTYIISTEPITSKYDSTIHLKLFDYNGSLKLRNIREHKAQTPTKKLISKVYHCEYSIVEIAMNINSLRVVENYGASNKHNIAHFITYLGKAYLISPIDYILKTISSSITPNKLYQITSVKTDNSSLQLLSTSFVNGIAVFSNEQHKVGYYAEKQDKIPNVLEIPDIGFKSKIVKYNEDNYTWIVTQKQIPSIPLHGFPYFVDSHYGGLITHTAGCLYGVSANLLINLIENPTLQCFQSNEAELKTPYWWSTFL